jgi:hypothetical protein
MGRESFPPASEANPREPRGVEGGLAEILKRIIEAGARNLNPDGIRQVARDLKLPREAIHFAFSQLDETKNGLYRVVASELRQFLESSNLGDELARALTKLSFEVKMNVRFVPNDGLKRPQVSTQVRVRGAKGDAKLEDSGSSSGDEAAESPEGPPP